MARKEGRSQSCDAVLKINGQEYPGATGKDCGHAEMHALHCFILANPGNRDTAKQSIAYCAVLLGTDAPKYVFCPSRPCCRKCTQVLKGLGFKLGAGSEWSDTPMGSTEWGVSLNVRALLEACGVDYEKIKGLS